MLTRRQLIVRGAGLSLMALMGAGPGRVRGWAQSSPSVPIWPMFRGNPEHTGMTDQTGQVQGPTQTWRFGTRGAVEPSAAVGDVDGDGQTEVVISSFDGAVYAIPGAGRGLIQEPLWKVQTDELIWSSPAIGDVDGDGNLEVVVGSDDQGVYVVDGPSGRVQWRFATRAKVRASPTIADVDGDGDLEIVIGSGQIFALDARAQRVKWKFRLATTTFSSAAVSDLDGDGDMEVVVGSYDNILYALSGRNGQPVWQHRATNPIDSSPAIGDINGDGQLEIAVGVGFVGSSGFKGVQALGGDGRQLWEFSIGEDERVVSSPAIGDVDGDGQTEVVVGSNAGRLFAFDGAGNVKYTHDADKFIESSPTMGDIDGDGRMEVVVGSHDFRLYALRADPDRSTFDELWTFTPPAANIFFSSPTLADVNDDGNLEIVIGNNNGTLYALGA